MGEDTKFGMIKTAVIILVFVVVVLLNNMYMLNKISQERADRIIELDEKIKNLQSRIDLNVSEIENLKRKAD